MPKPTRPPPLWLLMLLACTGTLAMHMFVPALPATAVDLGLGAAEVQLSIGVYVLTLGIGQLIYGPLSDALGRRPVAMLGVVAFVLGSLACAAAGSLGALLIGRVLQAAGGAAGLTVARAAVRDLAGAGGSQKDIALLNLIMLIGPGVSPVLGAWLAVGLGWRAIFLTLAGAAMVLLLFVIWRLPETVPKRLPFALDRIWREQGALLANRRFVAIATGGALASTQTYGYFAAAPYILTEELGVAPAQTGIYIGGILAGAFCGTLAARLRVGRVSQNHFIFTAAASAVLVAGLFLGLALLGALTPLRVFGLTFALMLSGGAISPTALAASLDSAADRAGAAAGFFGAAQMFAGAVCTALVGLWPVQSVSTAAMLLAASSLSLALLWRGRQSG